MIRFSDNSSEIVPLWQQAFGDSADEIMFFIENVKDAKCLMYYADGKPASMIYLVKCVADGDDAYYVYAACTAKGHESKGYMTKLIDYCFDEGYTVCLIPASDSLVEFYSRRGISRSIPIESIAFSQSEEIIEYLLEGYPCL